MAARIPSNPDPSAIWEPWLGNLRSRLPAGSNLPVAGLADSPGLPLGEALAVLHRALADKGRLLLASDNDPREVTASLSEAGFVILKQEPGAWLARKEPFFVREYQEGDEEQILPMFRRSFYVDRSLARWSWEYRDNPYGNLKISEAFSEDGRLVAHYAGYPVRFHCEAGTMPRTFEALQIGDTMTEPSVRHVGRGPTSLLGRTVRHFYARFCEGRVDFNYGVNTGNIQRFSMSFVGARRLEPLPFFVRETARPVPAPHPLLQRLAGYRVEKITGFDERWDELFRRVRGDYRLLVERDARYLDWRYARCPDAGYFLYAVWRRRKLVGWSVFRHEGGEAALGGRPFRSPPPRGLGRAPLPRPRRTGAPRDAHRRGLDHQPSGLVARAGDGPGLREPPRAGRPRVCFRAVPA